MQGRTSTLSQPQSARFPFDLARGHKTGTPSDMLQRRFTATPARCWAALYGVGCLSVRPATAVSLSPAGHLSACVFMSRQTTRPQRPAPQITGGCPNKIPTKLVYYSSSLAGLPIDFKYFSKQIPTPNSPSIGVVPFMRSLLLCRTVEDRRL